MSNLGGRPRIIETPELFDEMVDAYIQECKDTEQVITLTGLIIALGLSGRQALDNYGNYDGFVDSVKRAKLFIEHTYEQKLHGTSPTGAIFGLKNMGWKDKHEVENVNHNFDYDVMSDAELERIASGKE